MGGKKSRVCKIGSLVGTCIAFCRPVGKSDSYYLLLLVLSVRTVIRNELGDDDGFYCPEARR